jgi:hypothetical protein
MGTSALSSEMAMGRRPIAKSGLFSLVNTEDVHLQGGTFLGGGGALFRSSLWFIGMWVISALGAPPARGFLRREANIFGGVLPHFPRSNSLVFSYDSRQ